MALSNIKVLLLNVNRDGWHSGNMIYDMEAVRRACDTKIYGPGWPEYKHTNIPKIISQLYGNGKPDVIYSYFTENEVVRNCYMNHFKISSHLGRFCHGLKDVNGPLKIFALSDFWSRKSGEYAKDLIGSTFKYCFACFAPPYSSSKHFYAFFNEQIRKEIEFVGYPRCVDAKCYRDYGMPKVYDVITLGSMYHFYPFRVYIHQYLQKHHKELGIKYHNYPHCGTDFKHSNFVRENYAKAINGSKILASCGGRYGVAYNKIFESMGCGTVYVGDRPHGEKELHMEDGINYVAVTKQDLVDKIKYYLDRPDKMTAISNNAKETFQKYHNIDSRAKDFLKLIEERL